MQKNAGRLKKQTAKKLADVLARTRGGKKKRIRASRPIQGDAIKTWVRTEDKGGKEGTTHDSGQRKAEKQRSNVLGRDCCKSVEGPAVVRKKRGVASYGDSEKNSRRERLEQWEGGGCALTTLKFRWEKLRVKGSVGGVSVERTQENRGITKKSAKRKSGICGYLGTNKP